MIIIILIIRILVNKKNKLYKQQQPGGTPPPIQSIVGETISLPANVLRKFLYSRQLRLKIAFTTKVHYNGKESLSKKGRKTIHDFPYTNMYTTFPHVIFIVIKKKSFISLPLLYQVNQSVCV